MSGGYNASAKEKCTPEGYIRVTEGFAAVLFLPPNASKQSKETVRDDQQDQSIFYNPAQVVNRDLSVSMIETFAKIRMSETRRRGGVGSEGITILEALSATGLRAIRYWKEIAGVKSIVANDLDPEAVDAIKRNCDFNDVPIGTQSSAGIIPNCDDAITLMQRLGLDPNLPYRLCAVDKETGSPLSERTLLQSEKMDVVDLDPYGTASPFLDSAMQCAKEGALMLVTCTDSSILCGNYPETCFAKYGAFSTRIDSCHEVATRLVLGLIESTANRHRKFIQPLLSLHIDFYVRVFVRVWTQPAEVKRACVKLANLFHCTRCPFFKVSPLANTRMTRRQAKKTASVSKRERDGEEEDQTLPDPWVYPKPAPRDETVVTQCASTTNFPTQCEACGNRVLSAGPIYAAPTHDREFLAKAMDTITEKASQGRLTAVDRIKGLVRSAMDELPDAPLFYDLPEVASACGIHCPPTAPIVAALAKMGYSCSQVHCKASGIKTTAPPKILFGVVKYFNTVNPQPPQKCQEKKETTAEQKKGDADRKKGREENKITIVYPEVPCDLSYEKDFDWRSKTTGVVKFVPNAPFWGPKRRHQGVKKEDE